MVDIEIAQQCAACHGTGTRIYNPAPGQPLVEENPCSECGGDGKSPSYQTITSAYFDEKFEAVMEELDYIHGKVTAIWNAVKPP